MMEKWVRIHESNLEIQKDTDVENSTPVVHGVQVNENDT